MSTPGLGGSYRYNPQTDQMELVDYTKDASGAAHPLDPYPPTQQETLTLGYDENGQVTSVALTHD